MHRLAVLVVVAACDLVPPPASAPSAYSAPYFHDGSAATLEVVLRDRGHVHGMSDGGALGDGQIADLETL